MFSFGFFLLGTKAILSIRCCVDEAVKASQSRPDRVARRMIPPKNGRERVARYCGHRAGRLGRLSDGAGLGYRALATLHSGSQKRLGYRGQIRFCGSTTCCVLGLSARQENGIIIVGKGGQCLLRSTIRHKR